MKGKAMRVESILGEAGFDRLGAVDLACSWCGSAVRLFEGDYSGVCIDCGTVMFRKSVFCDGSDERGSWRQGTIGAKVPPPSEAPLGAA